MTTLEIKKNPPIQNGVINVAYLPDTEQFSYSGHVKVKLGPFSKKIPFGATEIIPRDKMKSSSYGVGSVINYKEVEITVRSNDGTTALVTFDTEDVDGTAELDVTGEYIDFVAIHATAKIQGISLTVDAYRI